jgi:hypothetical protein
MANTIATSPGTMADDATVGTIAWTNPDNAKVSDDVYATFTVNGNATSHYLKATNFGFSIPTGATINGILVEIEKKCNVYLGSKTIFDSSIKIVKSDGTIGSTDKSVGTLWSDTEAYVSYGSSSDSWGETWDSTKINDVDFGMVISVISNGSYPSIAYIDHIRITVYYTETTTTSIGILLSKGLPFA